MSGEKDKRVYSIAFLCKIGENMRALPQNDAAQFRIRGASPYGEELFTHGSETGLQKNRTNGSGAGTDDRHGDSSLCID